MAYTQLPTRTTSDTNSASDVNQLQLNIEALKGGTPATAPSTTIEGLATSKGTTERNFIHNGAFKVNQRGFASGGTLGAGVYGHDRWKAGSGGCNYTFATSGGVTTITIPSSKELLQIIEGINLVTGTYTLSWTGTAQGKIGGGAFSASGITASVTGGSDLTITFNAGTVRNVMLNIGSVALPFEQEDYSVTLAKCQRYLCKVMHGTGFGLTSTTVAAITCKFPTSMRVGTTTTQQVGVFTLTDSTADYAQSGVGTAYVLSASANTESITFGLSNFSGLTGLRPVSVHDSSNVGYFLVSREL